MIAGFERPDAGEVSIDGVPVRGVGSERAASFQEPRLLPWMSGAGRRGLRAPGPGGAPGAGGGARDAIRLMDLRR